MEDTFTLVYRSEATVDEFSVDSLDILREAIDRNTREGMTGFLHRERGLFFQAIEGREPVVRKLFEGIRRDRRHGRVRVLLECTFRERAFTNWHMGYSSEIDTTLRQFCGRGAMTPEQLAELDGMTVYRFLVKTGITRRIAVSLRGGGASFRAAS